MSRVVARIPQVDGGVRVVLAQDTKHARRAREILRDQSAMIDRLDGVDGIQITTRDE